MVGSARPCGQESAKVIIKGQRKSGLRFRGTMWQVAAGKMKGTGRWVGALQELRQNIPLGRAAQQWLSYFCSHTSALTGSKPFPPPAFAISYFPPGLPGLAGQGADQDRSRDDTPKGNDKSAIATVPKSWYLLSKWVLND